jgi:hypothetical protein
LNDTWEIGALTFRAHTAVLCTTIPATVLARATVENADTSTWDEKVELIGAKIATGIGSLNDQLLTLHRAGCECEFVALAAPSSLIGAGDCDRCKTIGEVVIDGKRCVVSAGISGSTTVASRFRVIVAQWVLILVAGLDGIGD